MAGAMRPSGSINNEGHARSVAFAEPSQSNRLPDPAAAPPTDDIEAPLRIAAIPSNPTSRSLAGESSRGSLRVSTSLGRQATTSFRSVVSSGVGSFRSITSQVLQVAGLQAPPTATFRCAICLENVHPDERVVFKSCTSDHKHCQPCIREYVRGLIADGRVNHICCPGDKCKVQASPEEVRAWSDSDTFDKFERFKAMKADTTLRQCSKCEKLFAPELDQASEPIPEMKCECGHEFCYYHSDAHVGKPCGAYRRQMSRDLRLAREGALANAKECPKCGILTDKVSGCNHMTCASCRGNWCWVCNKQIERVGWHYSPNNPHGCQQFSEAGEERGPLMKCMKIAVCPVSFLSMLVVLACCVLFVPVFLVFAVLGFPVVRDCSKVALFSCFVALVPFFVWQLAWIILCCPLTLLLHCLCCHRVTEAHRSFLMQVPFQTVLSCMEFRHGNVEAAQGLLENS